MSFDKYYELLREVNDLPSGDLQIQRSEELVRMADELNDLDLRYQARESYIDAAIFGGEDEKALVAFAWCRTTFDENPDSFDEFTFLWRYKWIIGRIAGFPSVSRGRIQEMLEELETRIQKGGYAAEVIVKLKLLTMKSMGDREGFDELLDEWLKMDTGLLSDCEACRLNTKVIYLLGAGRFEEAMRAVAPILSGELSCKVVPHVTYNRLLLPLHKHGRREEAVRYQKEGYRLISDNKNFLGHVADHITYLIVAGEITRALNYFEKHLPWTISVINPRERFDFYLSGWLLMTVLVREKEQVSLKLPRDFPIRGPEVSIRELSDWLEKQTREIAGKFNKRNGNLRFSKLIEKDFDLIKADSAPASTP